MGGGLTRTLGIEPITRGFGWSVLEGTERLIDWGVVRSRASVPESWQYLLARYAPDQVAVPVLDAHRLGHHAAEMRDVIAAATEAAGTTIVSVDRQLVLDEFTGCGAMSRRTIALAVSRQFPELGSLERHWKLASLERLAIYSALANGLAIAT